MAKDGNGAKSLANWFFAIIVVVLAPLLHEVIQSAKANAAQDTSIAAILKTNDRVEHKLDRILDRLLKPGG